jgi:hypothetical protein
VSLWDKLTGKKQVLSETELQAQAEAFFHELEQLIHTNPKAAMKMITKRPQQIEPVIDFAGPFHERFAHAVLRVAFLKESRKDPSRIERTYRDLPSVTVLADEQIDTFGALLDSAGTARSDVIFMQFIKDWPRDALAAIEALYVLATDPSALFIIHAGPNNLFIRGEYLISVGNSMSRDMKIEKAPDELFYIAEAQPGVNYDDYVVTPYGYALCKFYRESH